MDFKLTVLGSNSALPTAERFATAHLLNASERFFLIDCGEGTQIQLRRFRAKFSKIKHIFISHLHGDHFFGLFGVLSTFDLLGRQAPLNIHAHPKLKEILDFHKKKIGEQRYPILFHPITPGQEGIIHEDSRVVVKTFPMKHRIPANGFLFRERDQPRSLRKDAVVRYKIPIKEIQHVKNGADLHIDGRIIPNKALTLPPYKARSYAFCSDTGYDTDIIPYIKNVDILYHEATFRANMADHARETLHSTTTQAATIAKRADAGRLVIGHFSARHKRELDEMLQEARDIFPETYLAGDGYEYEVSRERIVESYS